MIGLPEGEWALWRWSALRGAGFPASHALALSVKECPALADRLLDAQQNAETAWQHALTALRQEVVSSDDEDRTGIAQGVKAVEKGQSPRLGHG